MELKCLKNKMSQQGRGGRSRPQMPQKEIKYFGNSFDEQATQNAQKKCQSPKFFRTQSFAVLSPKLSKKMCGSEKKFNYSQSVKSSSESICSISTRSSCCSVNSSNISSLSNVNDIIDENNEFVVVNEVRVFDRLKRLRHRLRKSSISAEAYEYDALRDQR